MADAEPAPFTAGEGLSIHGERAGEGPPVVLCHGVTATRRYVLHGSRALERRGYETVSYDARGHGASDPAPPGEGYGYPEMVGDLRSVLAETAGDRPYVFAGHSMGAHTAVAHALTAPEGLAGLVLIGPVYAGEGASAQALEYWDGLAESLETGGAQGFVDFIDRHQDFDPAWRETVLRITRERIGLHRRPAALSEAIRQVSRSRPFGAMEELETLEVPALVVASHDAADPGHPYATAAAYAECLPQGRLVSEEEGDSPLAWRGGLLSREIAEFCCEPSVSSRLFNA